MKIKNKIFLYFILLSTFTIKYIENSTIQEVRDSIKEVIYSYYMRGKYIQSNTAKDKFFSPEEATSQNLNHLVTTSFTTTVYQELLNILVPYSPTDLLKYAGNREGSPEVFMFLEQVGEKLEFKRYSEADQDNYELLYDPTYNEIIQHLEIGDLLVQGGFGVIVYDKIEDENGISDIIVASSSAGIGGGYIKTKIERNSINYDSGEFFSSIGISLYLNNKTNENIGDEGLEEGSIGLIKLSDIYLWRLIKEQKPIYSKIVVFRFLNEKDGKTILNYQNYYAYFNNTKNYSDNDVVELNDKNKDRAKYKHLFIEKTVDKNHNNIVELGESLTYKIIIKNNYKEKYNDELIVTEYLSEFVTFKSHKESKKVLKYKKEDNKLMWNIGKLGKKEEIIIEYTVKVTSGEKNNIIQNIGYVGNITSSVFNVIGTNLKKEQMDLIKKNYDKLKKKYNGTTLINEIYKKSFKEVDIQFDKFNITDLIINDPLDSRGSGHLNLNKTNPFYETVLNKYWSSLAKINHTFVEGGENVNVYSLKEFNYFEKPNTINRENFIYKETFKTGDILIYTNYNDTEYTLSDNVLHKNNITYEEGEYSYIFIEGKGFVGVNYGDKGILNTIYNRNEFNAKYYINNQLDLYVQNKDPVSDEFLEIANYQTLFGKDYYVILRPSLCFDLPYEKEKEKSNAWAVILFSILGIILFLAILYVLWKSIKLKQSGKEINLQNFKETPLLG